MRMEILLTGAHLGQTGQPSCAGAGSLSKAAPSGLAALRGQELLEKMAIPFGPFPTAMARSAIARVKTINADIAAG
jgi:hypothetical protein